MSRRTEGYKGRGQSGKAVFREELMGAALIIADFGHPGAIEHPHTAALQLPGQKRRHAPHHREIRLLGQHERAPIRHAGDDLIHRDQPQRHAARFRRGHEKIDEPLVPRHVFRFIYQPALHAIASCALGSIRRKKRVEAVLLKERLSVPFFSESP